MLSLKMIVVDLFVLLVLAWTAVLFMHHKGQKESQRAKNK